MLPIPYLQTEPYTGVVTYGDTDGTYAGTGWLNYDDLQDAYDACPEGGVLVIAPGVHQVPDRVRVQKRIDIIGHPTLPRPVLLDPGTQQHPHTPSLHFQQNAHCLVENIEFRSANSGLENATLRWDAHSNHKVHFNKCRIVAIPSNYCSMLSFARIEDGSHPVVYFTNCDLIAGGTAPSRAVFRWVDLRLISIDLSQVTGNIGFQTRGNLLHANYVNEPTSGFGVDSGISFARSFDGEAITAKAIELPQNQRVRVVLFIWDSPQYHILPHVAPNGEWVVPVIPAEFGVYYIPQYGQPRAEGPYPPLQHEITP